MAQLEMKKCPYCGSEVDTVSVKEKDGNLSIEVKSKCRWIPCSERLPEQSGIYLAYFTFKDGTHATDIAYINTGCHLGSITHWMPLPEPPKE